MAAAPAPRNRRLSRPALLSTPLKSYEMAPGISLVVGFVEFGRRIAWQHRLLQFLLERGHDRLLYALPAPDIDGMGDIGMQLHPSPGVPGCATVRQ